MSRNSITTESADTQCVGVPVLEAISDRPCVLRASETGGVFGGLDHPVARGRERNQQGLENRIIKPEFGSAEEGKGGRR